MGGNFALIVGNSDYEDQSLAALVSPAFDVRELAGVLQDPEIGGFTVISLVNEPEVRVRRGIASLFTHKKPDDLLLLYLSTHGILDENGRLFLAARDTQRDLLKATAISASFITDEMDNSSSRRQVLVLDCCHSGAFARGIKGVPGSSVSTGAAFQGNGFGRVVLTATDSTQYAWDGDRVVGGSDVAPSIFTRHLIEGLRTGAADEDDDGRITLDELYEYVYRQVLSESPRQTPGKWSYKQQGNLVIAQNPHSGHKISELPEHLRKALESDFTSTREAAIRDLERYLHGPQAGLARAAEQALERISTEDDSRRIQLLSAALLAEFRKAKEKREERPSRQPLAGPVGASQNAPMKAMNPSDASARLGSAGVLGSLPEAPREQKMLGKPGVSRMQVPFSPAQPKSAFSEEKRILTIVFLIIAVVVLILVVAGSMLKKEDPGVKAAPATTEPMGTELMGTETEPMGTETTSTEPPPP